MKSIAPEYIHQIFINEDDAIPEFPLAIQENIRSVKVWYPEAKYKLWTRSELEQFIREDFDSDVLMAFQTLRPFAYKADLARYCLLYIFGGLYIDLGIRLFTTIEAPLTFGFLGFRDLLNRNSMWNAISNGLFWVQDSHRKELILTIDAIVENVKSNFYGTNPLYPTGPVLFGKSISKVMSDTSCYHHDEFWIGDVKYIAEANTIYFLTPANQLVAMRMQSLSHSDIINKLKTNAYNEFWIDRQVYENAKNWQWQYRDDTIYCDNVDVVGTKTLQAIEWCSLGMICYGPYIALQAGKYHLDIQLGHSECKGLEVEVTANNGEIIIFRNYTASDDNQIIKVDFTLTTELSRIEFRLYAIEDKPGKLLGYKLYKKDLVLNKE